LNIVDISGLTEMHDAIEPDSLLYAVIPHHHQKFLVAAGTQVCRDNCFGLLFTVGIAPCQSERLTVHDSQFIFAVQSTGV
jgi:hypothetical protein